MKRIFFLVLTVVVIITISMKFFDVDDLATCQDLRPSTECQAVDAIVVVSGGQTWARTDEAILLWQRKFAPILIFAGAAADVNSPSNAEAMKSYAVNRGVPSDAIITESKSLNTRQNAINVAPIIRSKKIKRLILVTSGYHMRRTSLEFQRQIGSDTVILSHPTATDSNWGEFWWLNIHSWYLALTELIGIIVFYIRGIIGW